MDSSIENQPEFNTSDIRRRRYRPITSLQYHPRRQKEEKSCDQCPLEYASIHYRDPLLILIGRLRSVPDRFDPIFVRPRCISEIYRDEKCSRWRIRYIREARRDRGGKVESSCWDRDRQPILRIKRHEHNTRFFRRKQTYTEMNTGKLESGWYSSWHGDLSLKCLRTGTISCFVRKGFRDWPQSRRGEVFAQNVPKRD